MNSLGLFLKKTSSFLIILLVTCFSLNAKADRLRYCQGELEVALHERNADLEGYSTSLRTLYSGIQTAGFHGGIQANTARGRARDRLKSCVSYWLGHRSNLPIEAQADCDNALVNSGASSQDDFFQKTQGKNIQEALIGSSVYGSICGFNHFYRDQVHATAKLTITGDNRCGSTTEYTVNLGPKYKFCASGEVYANPASTYLNSGSNEHIVLKNTLYQKTLANRIMFADDALYVFDSVPSSHRDLIVITASAITYGTYFAAATIGTLIGINLWVASHLDLESVQEQKSFLAQFTESGKTNFMRQNAINAWDTVIGICTTDIDDHSHEHATRLLVRSGPSRCTGFLFENLSGNLEFSDNQQYMVDANDRTMLWIEQNAAVPAQVTPMLRNGRHVYVVRNGRYYFAFVPQQLYIRDCCHTAEEVMAGTNLTQGQTNSYVVGSEGLGAVAASNVIGFADFDNPGSRAQASVNYYNALRGFQNSRSGSTNNNANPSVGQAYAIARMAGYQTGANNQYPYHVAAVIAEDADARITMEVFATDQDGSAYDTTPNFRIYSIRTGGANPTFHQTWSGSTVGNGALTFVIGSLQLYLRNLPRREL